MKFLDQDFVGMHAETDVIFQTSGSNLILAPYNKISLSDGDSEFQLHTLEKSAYTAVLKAFYAQSNALSWGKEELITELRKELGISDVEHREVLALVSSDVAIKQLRGRRKQSECQVTHEADHHRNYDVIHVGSRKKKLTADCRSAPAPISDYISFPLQAQLVSNAAPNLLKSKMEHKICGIGSPLSALPCSNISTVAVGPHFEQISYLALARAHAPVPALANACAPILVPAPSHSPATAPALACGPVSAPAPFPMRAPVTAPASSPSATPTVVPILRASNSVKQQPPSKKKRISRSIHIRQTDVLVKQIKETCRNGRSDLAVAEKAKQLPIDQERSLMEAICIIDDVTDNEKPPKKGRKKGYNTSRHHNKS